MLRKKSKAKEIETKKSQTRKTESWAEKEIPLAENEKNNFWFVTGEAVSLGKGSYSLSLSLSLE